jgi:hypothetical protein
MSLRRAVLCGSPLNARVATTSGHTSLMPGNRCDIRHTRTQEQLRSRLLFVDRQWHRTCTLMLQRGGRHLVAETDSAANQFGAPESVQDPRGTFPLFVARVCPSRICRISG